MSHGKASRRRGKVGNGVWVGNCDALVGVGVLPLEGDGSSSLHERHRDGDERTRPATVSVHFCICHTGEGVIKKASRGHNPVAAHLRKMGERENPRRRGDYLGVKYS